MIESKLFAYAAVCLLALTGLAAAQEEKSEPISALIQRAWDEVAKLEESGGKPDAEDHPGKKWADLLWKYHKEHPESPDAARAAAEALHLLIHSDMADEAMARADTLAADSAAWNQALGFLLEAAGKTGDYSYLIAKAKHLIDHSPDKKLRIRALFGLGQAYWESGKLDQAKATFQQVIGEDPNSILGKRAHGNIHEIDNLNLGQPAPPFSAKTISGKPISLADFKGKVVLLNFWSAW